MEEKIYPKKIGGKTYYYLQSTYREKVNLRDKKQGKGPGSGKSRVRTQSEYLGSASKIKKGLRESKSKCIEAKHQNFGMVAVAYQITQKIGLIDVLKKYITGERYGIPRYLFFLLAIINKVDSPVSKEKMGHWAKNTILPQFLQFDHKKLNSKTFWYVTDDILSEKELQEKRLESEEDDIFVHLDDSILCDIETEIFDNVRRLFELDLDCFFYDTTNFFTYIQPQTPSNYAEAGHNKEGRHYLKQIGLAVAVESEFGLPFFHRVYMGNSHDSSTFSGIIQDLLSQVNKNFGKVTKKILVLDKGNNSRENFDKIHNKINWIGSLILSHHKDLQNCSIEKFTKSWGAVKYFSLKREVMGHECLLVVTYNSKLYRKQEHSLKRGVKKCKKLLHNKLGSYKNVPKNKIPKGMETLKADNRYGKFFEMHIENGIISFSENNKKIKEEKVKMGKNLLFTDNIKIDPVSIISTYKDKDAVEKGFHLLKAPEMIKQRPIRHWTDTKIRAYCFTCVSALLIVRVMNMMTKKANLEMSSTVLKEELQDLKWIRMIYENLGTESIVSARSSIQKKLWELFELEEVEKKLTIHS